MATGIFILLVQRWEMDLLGNIFPPGTHEDLGVGSEEEKKTRNKSSPANKRNLEVVPLSNKDNFGDNSTQQSMGPSKYTKKTKIVLEKSHFSFSLSLG